MDKKLKKYIRLLEKDHIEEDLESLTAKDRLNWYLLIKEFEIPKLQRAGFQSGSDKVDEIVVTYIDKKEIEKRRKEEDET